MFWKPHNHEIAVQLGEIPWAILIREIVSEIIDTLVHFSKDHVYVVSKLLMTDGMQIQIHLYRPEATDFASGIFVLHFSPKYRSYVWLFSH